MQAEPPPGGENRGRPQARGGEVGAEYVVVDSVPDGVVERDRLRPLGTGPVRDARDELGQRGRSLVEQIRGVADRHGGDSFVPWFNDQVAAHRFEQTFAETVFLRPTGLYSEKHRTLADLPDGARVSISKDLPNQACSLGFLAGAGLIELAPGRERSTVTLADIVANPKRLEWVEVDLEATPRTLPDVDAAVILGTVAAASVSRQVSRIDACTRIQSLPRSKPEPISVRCGRESPDSYPPWRRDSVNGSSTGTASD